VWIEDTQVYIELSDEVSTFRERTLLSDEVSIFRERTAAFLVDW